MRVRAALVWTPEGARTDAVVEFDRDGRVRAVRPARAGDPSALPGLLVPGLVNAHTHLELSGLSGRVPGGEGMVAWVERLMAERHHATRDAALAGAEALHAAGTAVACDVSNAGDTAWLLGEAGLAGVVQVEHLGFDRAGAARQVTQMATEGGEERGRAGPIRRRPTVHGLHSTAPALLDAALSWRGPGDASPASVHVAESEDELALLTGGVGPFAAFLDGLGRDWRWWEPPGRPVPWLAARGALSSRLLLVHLVHADAHDHALVARGGASVCLCPRSNLHVEGRLPDALGLVGAGVPLCLGTDSLASAPDLDVLGEIRVLAAAFPEVPVAVWLDAATRGGADALGFPDHGRIAPGARPGLLLLDVDRVEDLAATVPSRRWIVPPGGP